MDLRYEYVLKFTIPSFENHRTPTWIGSFLWGSKTIFSKEAMFAAKSGWYESTSKNRFSNFLLAVSGRIPWLLRDCSTHAVIWGT